MIPLPIISIFRRAISIIMPINYRSIMNVSSVYMSVSYQSSMSFYMRPMTIMINNSLFIMPIIRPINVSMFYLWQV